MVTLYLLQDSTGLPNVVYLFLVGMLMAQGTFIGFEAYALALSASMPFHGLVSA